MKDERYWDYTNCLIGHPCKNCADTCTFRLDKDADEKENDKNERTVEESKRTS